MEIIDKETAEQFNQGTLKVVASNGIRLRCWEGRWSALVAWIERVSLDCSTDLPENE